MKWQIKLALVIVGTILAGYLAINYLLPIFAPFLLAAIIALLIEPLVGFFERKAKISRGLSVAISMALVLSLLGLLVTVIVIRLITELIELSNSLPQFSYELGLVLKEQIEKAQSFYWSLPPDLIVFLQKAAETLQSNISSIVGNLQQYTLALVNTFSHFLAGVPGGIIFLIVALIAVYFFSRDRVYLVQGFYKLLPAPWDKKVNDISKEIFQAVISFLKAQIILVSITMIMTIIGLSIIGSNYALIMGLTIGFFDLLPILGPSSVYIPWILWEFIRGNTSFAFSLTALYVVVLSSRQVLETKIVAQNLGLHPLATLVSMYVGLKVLGIIGIIIGPLTIIAVNAIIRSGIIVFRFKP